MTQKAFDPNQISIKKFKPLNDTVIVSDMVFDQRITSSGIILLNDNGKGTGIRPRWGRVYAVGPRQHDVTVGQWICVAHGRWTRGVEVQDETGAKTIRKIDPKDILLVTDQAPQDDTMSDAVHVESRR
jgi:co-chaperonin GroES (HSP10)